MENKCYLCHSPSADQQNSVAPSMVAIKAHYTDDETTKKVFTDDLMTFLKAPSPDNAKMRDAVCLQCHGTPEKDIIPQVYGTFKNKYPEAIGYSVNEVRGIWSINFDKNKLDSN